MKEPLLTKVVHKKLARSRLDHYGQFQSYLREPWKNPCLVKWITKTSLDYD